MRCAYSAHSAPSAHSLCSSPPPGGEARRGGNDVRIPLSPPLPLAGERSKRTSRSAVFAGVARDCAAHLPGVLQNLERFAASYRAASFLFVVSDSKDDTRAILERWLADGRRGRVIDLGTLEERLTKRTERIAFARNAGLDEIARGADAGHDHLVVADLDDVLAQPIDADAFARAAAWLDADPARAGVMANAMPRYYDVWALRHERWCPRRLLASDLGSPARRDLRGGQVPRGLHTADRDPAVAAADRRTLGLRRARHLSPARCARGPLPRRRRKGPRNLRARRLQHGDRPRRRTASHLPGAAGARAAPASLPVVGIQVALAHGHDGAADGRDSRGRRGAALLAPT